MTVRPTPKVLFRGNVHRGSYASSVGFVPGRISAVLERLTHISHCVHVVETFGWVGFYLFSSWVVKVLIPTKCVCIPSAGKHACFTDSVGFELRRSVLALGTRVPFGFDAGYQLRYVPQAALGFRVPLSLVLCFP